MREDDSIMYLPASSNLLRLRKYLDRYMDVGRNRPAALEFLVAVAFHRIFHLPFQSRDTEDESVKNRVIWYGGFDERSRRFEPASAGPDGICFAYRFYILIESTLRGNVSTQWRREFVESLNHYDEFVRARNLERSEVYLALIAPEFHRSTYTGFKQKAVEGYNILMLESSTLAKVSNISENISTLRHLDLRYLVNNIVKKFRESTSLKSFKKDLNRCVADWEVELLKQEKTVYFGLKSYEAMKKAGSNIVGVSDIMLRLERDRKFERYLKKLGGGDLVAYIREGLLRERLARIVETPTEDFFCRVDAIDFKARGSRLIRAVEEIDQ